jgi:hypothetical protein
MNYYFIDNPCWKSKCSNGGTCEYNSALNNFTCNCYSGYNGTSCQNCKYFLFFNSIDYKMINYK